MDRIDDLVQAAREAQKQAYAPYSGFLVGAALLDENGKIHAGCNVENGSYGLTICAERNAFTSAVVQGIRQFAGLVVVSSGGVSPCGACRQFAAEFCEDLPVVLYNSDAMAVVEETNLSELLPKTFRLK